MAQENKKRGLLILFEGLDRCGKSTQCQKLYEQLINNKEQASIVRFPDRTTELGKMIDQYLKGSKQLNDQTIHLLFSANRWEKEQEIYEKLNNNEFIVMDRYAYSGVAFTSAKGLDIDWCKNCDVGLPKPDITFYMSASEDVIANRGDFGQERYEKKEFQQKVKGQFELLKNENGDWFEIDASQQIDVITKQVLDIVEQKRQDFQYADIKKLWVKY